jgi:hypothetical protein
MTHLQTLAIVLSLVSASVASADAVMPPPASCPEGSTPSTSHAGPHCSPSASCTMPATCGTGETCEAVGLCIERVACGGLMPPDAGPCFEEHVVDNCAVGGSCASGTCEVRSVCSDASAGGGCGCRAGAGSAALGLSALAAVALSLIARRR